MKSLGIFQTLVTDILTFVEGIKVLNLDKIVYVSRRKTSFWRHGTNESVKQTLIENI